jgi:hypothetical protein
MVLTIHNAKKCTFDGSDCFIVSLLDDRGRLLFHPASGRYDIDATNEHHTVEEAIACAREIAKRRAVSRITVESLDRTYTQVPLEG